jgi:hypothetical protein
MAFQWECCDFRLPAQSQLFDQRLVGGNVTGFDVIKQVPTLANHRQESTA